MTQQRRQRFQTAMLATAVATVFTFAVPGIALAGHEDRAERGHQGRDDFRREHGGHDWRYRPIRYDDHRRHRTHRGHGPRVRYHGSSCGRDAYRYGHQERRVKNYYYCTPCSHRFDSLHGLRRHVSHHHHVPFWRLPFMVVASTAGWFFHG
jgi:hypothetical protein